MISTRTVESLPVLSSPDRLVLAGKSRSERTALVWTAEFAQAVEIQPANREKSFGSRIKLVAWNAQYCRYIDESAKVLAGLEPDILLLSEMDYGMARSGQHHTTACLAEKLSSGYIYGVEALDLSDSQTNDVGYRGNAIISPAKLGRPGLIRLSALQSSRAVAGRLAVIATIEIAGREVVFASVHLENWTSPEARAGLMESLLRGIDDYAPGLPAVVAGDMNTLSFELDRATANDPDRFRRLIKEDPNRLLNPIDHEPLFAVAQQYGYSWVDCNVISKSTHRCNTHPLSLRGNTRNLDWFFVRGLQSSTPRVIDATPADIAWPLSDHEIICVDVAV